MNEFDIRYDGYTPDDSRSYQPYSPPRERGSYRPPEDPDMLRGHAAEETLFQPVEPEYRSDLRPKAQPKPDPKPATDPRPQPKPQPKAEQKPQEETAPRAPYEEEAEAREKEAKERKKQMEARLKELRKKERQTRSFATIKDFFTDERTRLFIALLLMGTSIFVLASVISHFKHGAEDQSATINLSLSTISENPGMIGNLTGGFGALLSHILLCDALGLGSLVLIPYLWKLALGLLGVRKCLFWGTTFRCLLLGISISIVLGLVTYTWPTEIYWGGNHGHYVNKFLLDNSNWIGAVSVSLLLIGALCCVYLNELKKAYNKWYAVYKRHKIQEELRRERRRELERLEEEAEAERREEERRIKAARKAEAEAKAKAEAEAKAVAKGKTPEADSQRNAVETEAVKINSIAPATTTDGLNERVSDDMIELPKTRTPLHTPTESAKARIESQEEELFVDITPAADTATDDVIIIDPEANGGTRAQIGDDFIINVNNTDTSDTIIQIEPVETGLYDHRSELPSYNFPPVDLLEDRPSGPILDIEEQKANKDLIEKTLLDYRIPISRIEATVGPTVTLYEIVPAEGVRISQIKRLEDDIALSLKALGIRIIAPIPGKGTVGIEVPNNDPRTVSMRSVICSKKYQECKMALPMAMGATISNDIFIADMAKMPHLLVAGATGMGKSVGLNTIIASLLYKKHPSELKFVLVDPKMVEFSLYSKLERHYLAKLPNDDDAIITDMKNVISTLNSLCVEMDNRYELLRNANVRSLEEYNKKFTERRLSPNDGHKYLPYIVVIVDEFADLIMTQGKEVEQPIARIAQKARAVGIHMILATQRPSTNVITGLIKANFPGRIAFRVIQMVDSRTILDCPGANQLIGRGDMLFSHNGIMERVQCAFISTEEVEALTEHINRQPSYEHAYYLPEYVPEEAEGGAIAGGSMERDALFNDAARFVVTRQIGSTSSLQRQFGIGYNRAGKLMDQLEAAGVVGGVNGAKPRAILMDIVTLESILGD